MPTIIAVPSSHPGGLDAMLGAHFGHCDLYTLVAVENDEVKTVNVVPNVPHQQGGCMAPVNYLAQNGVNKLIAGGMGLRPLMGFNQVGITVFFGGEVATIDHVIITKGDRSGVEGQTNIMKIMRVGEHKLLTED